MKLLFCLVASAMLLLSLLLLKFRLYGGVLKYFRLIGKFVEVRPRKLIFLMEVSVEFFFRI